ncbi:hypothetical protein MANY_18970 [Mycolicibacterium anyangense]|uniref:Uncharacterized protein n=1 Tax=Mycolicibacterium anyangense TaxID=1431246 RepID=A0A6N4W3Q5_9MYCO|nr:hypothetical protein [Mycolicibacterium anyangense]BBZ76560.1 hypothetical protein MANY_18970 [Mycolicibacterium anyangense]
MTTTIIKRAVGILTGTFAAGALALGIGMAPTASAADGCGYGYHLDGGTCVLNAPGPGAHFISPNCWINDNGDERCYAGS